MARRAGTHFQATGSARKFPPYLVLLRVGFTMPRALQRERCALTAPFHPYRAVPANNAAVFSLWHWPYPGLETWTPDVIRHTALRSSDFPPPRNIPIQVQAPARQRPSSPPAPLCYQPGRCRRLSIPSPLYLSSRPKRSAAEGPASSQPSTKRQDIVSHRQAVLSKPIDKDRRKPPLTKSPQTREASPAVRAVPATMERR